MENLYQDLVHFLLEIKLPSNPSNAIISTANFKKTHSSSLSYNSCRNILFKLVQNILHKNRKTLFKIIDDWVIKDLIPFIPDLQRNNVKKFLPNLGWRVDHEEIFNQSLNIIPKIRAFFSKLITKYFSIELEKKNIDKSKKTKFETRNKNSKIYGKVPYDIKNWIIIASIHSIGYLMLESYKMNNKNHVNYTFGILKLISVSLSDYIVSNFLNFFKICGWESLKDFELNRVLVEEISSNLEHNAFNIPKNISKLSNTNLLLNTQVSTSSEKDELENSIDENQVLTDEIMPTLINTSSIQIINQSELQTENTTLTSENTSTLSKIVLLSSIGVIGYLASKK